MTIFSFVTITGGCQWQEATSDRKAKAAAFHFFTAATPFYLITAAVTVTFFLLPAEHLRQVKGLQVVAEFNMHIPPLTWDGTRYFHLNNAAYGAKLAVKMPAERIVQAPAYNDGLPKKPPTAVTPIGPLAGSPPRLFAHVRVSQNLRRHNGFRSIFPFPASCFIQGDAAGRKGFERIRFSGLYDHLKPGLKSENFEKEPAKRGPGCRVTDRDYTDCPNTGAVILVRKFTGDLPLHKPNYKLINARAGGVPVSVTRESSSVDWGKSRLDFIEVGGFSGLLTGVDQLRAAPGLVEKCLQTAAKEGKEHTPGKSCWHVGKTVD